MRVRIARLLHCAANRIDPPTWTTLGRTTDGFVVHTVVPPKTDEFRRLLADEVRRSITIRPGHP
jgi:hypothetical protein